MAFHYLYEDSYALQQNQALSVCMHESYTPGMQYFHMHSHYEISFIMSGNVSILLQDQISSGTEVRVVMLRPFTLHYMIPEPDQVYKRICCSFTSNYIGEKSPDWNGIYRVFPQNGAIVLPDELQCRKLENIFSMMMEETDLEHNRYLLLYMIFYIV